MINSLAAVAILYLATCGRDVFAESIVTREQAVDAPVVVSLDLNHGSPDGIEKQQRMFEALEILGGASEIARSAAVTVNVAGIRTYFNSQRNNWEQRIGNRITLEVFDGRSIIVLNDAIHQYDASFGWTGSIVVGGSGRVDLWISEETGEVHGEIRLYIEDRRLELEPTGFADTHILFERTRASSPDAPSGMVKSTGDKLLDLERDQRHLEDELSRAGQDREAREATQQVLDSVVDAIDDEKRSRGVETVKSEE